MNYLDIYGRTGINRKLNLHKNSIGSGSISTQDKNIKNRNLYTKIVVFFVWYFISIIVPFCHDDIDIFVFLCF